MRTLVICFWNSTDPGANSLLFCIFGVMARERRRGAEKCSEEL
jgi:hypothetical protein